MGRRKPPGGPGRGQSTDAAAEENIRRLARALIASALDAYELQRSTEPTSLPTGGGRALPLSTSMYSRPRKRWGRAA